MSHKNKPHKPVAQKHETETGDDIASKATAEVTTEATAAGDEPTGGTPQADAPAQPDATADTADQPARPDESGDAAQPVADGSEKPTQPEAHEAESPEPVADIETVAEAPAPAITDGLSVRLTRVVSGILTSGKPDAVHALHKVEMTAGALKTALPAAIEACDAVGDEALKADLNRLLAAL